jgi:hypothetical protein
MKHSIPGTLKRISPAEKKSYIELDIYSKEVCTKAIAFSLTDIEEGIYPAPSYGTTWQKVTYYADQTSINNTSLSPLEFMYKEWNMNKDIDLERDLGDEREFNA